MFTMEESGYTADNFGEWSNTQERLEELRNRLAAWFLCATPMSEVFESACRRFELELTTTELDDPLTVPADALLKAFEDALDAYDTMLDLEDGNE